MEPVGPYVYGEPPGPYDVLWRFKQGADTKCGIVFWNLLSYPHSNWTLRVPEDTKPNPEVRGFMSRPKGVGANASFKRSCEQNNEQKTLEPRRPQPKSLAAPRNYPLSYPKYRLS